MSLLSSPAEVRGIILDFCFPPPQTYVQIVPYRTSLPACSCWLNLPLALYLPLLVKLRRLDFTHIIRGPTLHHSFRPEYGSKHDDDYERFPIIMRFAERVRLVGAHPIRSCGRDIGAQERFLEPGRKCALRVLEVQPRAWLKVMLVGVMINYLGALTTHPDVAERLEVRLARNADDPPVSDEEVRAHLREYQVQQETTPTFADPSADPCRGSATIGTPPSAGIRQRPRPPIWVDSLASLEEQGGEVKPNADMEKIEVWLKRFQDVEDVKQRSDLRGPLNGV
ncbi:hypothetical protein DFH08DRAFT_963267 [Mycena albidolilacea]|uniref:Uncharacterized protein n=1 Tax=Mycena albidolilacea TaxID=1033008 RepID=A0AAD6ZVM9_9AGAR|nr:hypothetical protein DFH08DRAFT_963267 [Mycena albidolilacea]